MRFGLLLFGGLIICIFAIIGLITVAVLVVGFLAVPESPNISGRIYDCRRLSAFEAWEVYSVICRPEYEPKVAVYCYPEQATLLAIDTGSQRMNLLLPAAIVRVYEVEGEAPTVKLPPTQIAWR